ncbi:HlyD family efflux transporter periplasmic adaptor subunit [Parasphingopyxis algicola]|uniref:efflux RND transporter periplasmic adaptor subunit n=1 Tax=Parasphingopyxis algicola TaxID=2026624 RepID=UPI0015A12222|nr:HlyD family efflux transporter periplasmic adaptor subunit [Parasphingopyxis algicola]QLC25389.1 HlyD family efflux transporter periplasmic adaptor subunit [Parasphingopyxis algicola]
MTRNRLIALGIIGGALVIAALLILIRPSPEERPPDQRAPLVQTVPAEIRSGSLTVEGAGTVRAREELVLAAEVPGKLVYVSPNLIEGRAVRRGEVLFRIDPTDYRNQVATARADVAQQDVAVREAEEEATLARREYERFQDREARRAPDPFSGVDADDFAAQILPPERLAQNQSPSAFEAPASREANSLTLRLPQLQAAQAALQRARAQLGDAQLALGRTTVRAPFSGLVRSENAARGSYVSPGQSLAEIVASGTFDVVVPLTQREAALIPDLWQRGEQRIEASVYADYGGQRYRWQAYVDRADPVLNPETRTIDIFLRVPNPMQRGQLAAEQADGEAGAENARAATGPPLLVGSFVQVAVDGLALSRYAAVPIAALRPGNQLWLVREGRLAIVPVEVLQRTDTEVFVRADPLGTDPQVIVGDIGVATDGMRVRTADDETDADAADSESDAE